MLKWLVQRKSIGNSTKNLDKIDGNSEEASQCTFIDLDDIYKSFSDENEKRDFASDDDSDIFIVSPQKTQHMVRKKSVEKRSQTSSNILSSIEEGIENDGLSIADSGISCDDDYDLDLDTYKTKYGNNNENYLKEKISNSSLDSESGDLLSSITQELFKRKNSINLIEQSHFQPIKRVDSISSNEQSQFQPIRRIEEFKFENEKPLVLPKPRRDIQKGGKEDYLVASYIKRNSQEEEDEEYNNNVENEREEYSQQEETIPKTISSSVATKYITDRQPYQFFSDIDKANNRIFSRLKLKADLLNPTLNGKAKYLSKELSHSLMSSMLWNAKTSMRLPSNVQLYDNMPPHHYTKREGNFIKDIHTLKSFQVNLDVKHYLPEEILVTLEDGKLVVDGKHFSDSEYGFESCQFHCRYPVTDGLKMAEISSNITDDGILTIAARCSTPEVKPKSKLQRNQKYNNSPPRTPPKTPELPRQLSSGNSLSPLETSYDSSYVHKNEFKETDANTYKLIINCKGYMPDDMRVKISGGTLIVQGKQKICVFEGQHERIRHKEFRKRYLIPKNANCHTLTSKMSGEDYLYVEVKKF